MTVDNKPNQMIMVRIGEITLKGLNRNKFERRLISNMRRRLERLGQFTITKAQSRIYIEAMERSADLEAAMQAIQPVFGVVSVSPVWIFDGSFDDLLKQAVIYVGELIQDQTGKSFKVETRRGDKRFSLTSMEISSEVGHQIMEAYPDQLRVDLHHPDFTLYVEIREQLCLYSRVLPGHRGLPVGTGGRGMLLLSGGIDSPVAGYLMASRGMELEAVYFHAFPYTSDQAREKVLKLAEILSDYTGRMTVHVVDFTDAQLALRDHCDQDMLTVITRRMMMRIAEQLAYKRRCKVLITGDSLGQVASQTLAAICAIDCVVTMPVFRPLIGMNKNETVRIAREIGTFETSIEPYEDCCTVFVAKHPKTHPSIDDAEASETGLEIDSMIQSVLEKIEVIEV